MLHLAQVKLGYDDGIAVRVAAGIDPDALVALNVGQSAREGETVQPVHEARDQDRTSRRIARGA